MSVFGSASRCVLRPAFFLRLVAALTLGALVTACGGVPVSDHRSEKPIAPHLVQRMADKGMMPGDPILVRIYKKESELEVWKRDRSGKYALLETFPICRWSGQLGPKTRQGDRQAPEGFYMVSRRQLNPNSNYHLAFNLGYPNAFDRAHDRTGDFLMVHGACTSMGCYAMTNENIEDIYALAREAFAGGQEAFQVQAFPFRMTAENFARHRLDPHLAFWKNLKEGAEHFEVAKVPPKVSVCGKRYVFNAKPKDGASLDAEGACPSLEVDEDIVADVAERRRVHEARVAELARDGVRPVRLVYRDGGMHASFRKQMEQGARLAWMSEGISRPEALETLPNEQDIDEPVGSIRR
jgi:murein L,D-transpeptidase YafK